MSGATLIPALRSRARQKLPDVYGASCVRAARSAAADTERQNRPERAARTDRADRSQRRIEPPRNDVERDIVRVLKELLAADEVGVDDNFFDLGANSLLMVQASVRLRLLLGRSVPLVRMFQFPTARSLAASLGAAEDGDGGAVKQSHDRAQVRKDAMLRLGELRGRRRSR